MLNKIYFTKLWNKTTRWCWWTRICFVCLFLILREPWLRLMAYTSALGTADEGFSGCCVLEHKPLLSQETLYFSAFIILLNLTIHSSWIQGHSSPTAVCRDGSLGLQRSSCPLFFLNQTTSVWDFNGRGESWNSDLWFIFCATGGDSVDAGFISKERRNVWQIELPQDRKCSFGGEWALYY